MKVSSNYNTDLPQSDASLTLSGRRGMPHDFWKIILWHIQYMDKYYLEISNNNNAYHLSISALNS